MLLYELGESCSSNRLVKLPSISKRLKGQYIEADIIRRKNIASVANPFMRGNKLCLCVFQLTNRLTLYLQCP